MENLELKGIWQGRRVFLTGQTGFKGAWMSLWLQTLGAKVTAIALPPPMESSLYSKLFPHGDPDHHAVDIRDADAVRSAILEARPEIVIHMAAQALVRQSYLDPVGTYAANVMGTVNVLEAVVASETVKTVIVVTSDKVYANDDRGLPFAEMDRLGGKDPYSNSKAATELVCQAYRDSFLSKKGIKLGSVRAGNVIGGGDWSEDRLVPDAIRAFRKGEAVSLRYPGATRPWQHVLEPLCGYLMFAHRLSMTQDALPPALNFGPSAGSFASVSQLVDRLACKCGIGVDAWRPVLGDHPVEATALTLSSQLAREMIGWIPRLDLDATIAWTADWYEADHRDEDMRNYTCRQIADYQQLIAYQEIAA